jgi:phosphomannomutase
MTRPPPPNDAQQAEQAHRAPIRLRPARLVPRPWGGTRLASLTGLPAPAGQRAGEAFLVSAWPQDDEARAHPSQACLDGGRVLPLPQLLDTAGAEILGAAHLRRFGPRWPLLPKLLDVGTLLSVQAHPPGQPEVYLILEAEPGATVAVGFRRDQDRATMALALTRARAHQDRLVAALAPGTHEAALEPLIAPWLREAGPPAVALLPALLPLLVDGIDPEELTRDLDELRSIHRDLIDALNWIPVRPGMVLYNRQLAVPPSGQLPSAGIHALGNPEGRSVVMVEIRLPGGTLRAWDHARFPRRPLDLDAALDALALRATPAGFHEVEPRPVPGRPGVARSVTTPLFALDHLTPAPGRRLELPGLPGASTLHALRGVLTLSYGQPERVMRLSPGDTIMVPSGLACSLQALEPDAEILHVTIPPEDNESRGEAVGSGSAQADGRRSDSAEMSRGEAVGSGPAKPDGRRSDSAEMSRGEAVGSGSAQPDGRRSDSAEMSRGEAVGSISQVAAMSRGEAVGSISAQPDGRRSVRLAFGTSGLRALVTEMTDREVYLATAGFLGFLEDRGELPPGAPLAIGEDLRARCTASGMESSPRIARAVAQACSDAGHPVIHCGQLPTPALAYWASLDDAAAGKRPMPAIMITGSHIPSDRNGVKFYKLHGEVLKSDEPAILAAVQGARDRLDALDPSKDPFDPAGAFHQPRPPLSSTPAAREAYLKRYLDCFGRDRPLAGRRLVFFEHSAVGRDLLGELFETLGAEVIRVGRTDGFVAIDTEDLGPDALASFQATVREHRPFALISTDGDSDRPLLIDEGGHFHRGDLLGLVTALHLDARAVAVPVSTNDAVDLHLAALARAGGPEVKLVKTRIGSPWVIAAMQAAQEQVRGPVVGWEANGGFLLGSDVALGGGLLRALPTRDAVLPLLAVLIGAARRGVPVSRLFAELPQRAATAALIDGVPTAASRAILAQLTPPAGLPPGSHRPLVHAFAGIAGLGECRWIETMDGLRIGFASGEIVHLRPSGNAPQLRCYAVADSRARAQELLDRVLRDTDSLVRRLLSEQRPERA